MQDALACGEAAAPVRQELTSRRQAGEAALRNRLQRARAEGNLAPDLKPAGLARFSVTLIQGMTVQVVQAITNYSGLSRLPCEPGRSETKPARPSP